MVVNRDTGKPRYQDRVLSERIRSAEAYGLSFVAVHAARVRMLLQVLRANTYMTATSRIRSALRRASHVHIVYDTHIACTGILVTDKSHLGIHPPATTTLCLSMRLARSRGRIGPLCFRGGRARSRERARGCEVAGIVSENHRARTLDGGKRA